MEIRTCEQDGKNEKIIQVKKQVTIYLPTYSNLRSTFLKDLKGSLKNVLLKLIFVKNCYKQTKANIGISFWLLKSDLMIKMRF
jgi:hypothetical protein